MRRIRTIAAAALTLLCIGSLGQASWGQSGPPSPAGNGMPRPRAEGYLGAGAVPDHRVFLPPPPAVDSPAGVADVAIFRGTRALEGRPRWQLAASDDRIGSRKMLGDFGCAMGIDFTGVEVPTLARTLVRANADLIAMVGAAKDYYQRPRPFVTESGPICVAVSADFAASGSYPSGHSAASWLYALLLAEIDPDHAAAIVARGRAFGESRVVCGVHYVSDVEGGRLTTSALVAALHGQPQFEADMAAARAELAQARTTAPKPSAATCPVDGALTTPW
jgi:acid phosphatase (class A)